MKAVTCRTDKLHRYWWRARRFCYRRCRKSKYHSPHCSQTMILEICQSHTHTMNSENLPHFPGAAPNTRQSPRNPASTHCTTKRKSGVVTLRSGSASCRLESSVGRRLGILESLKRLPPSFARTSSATSITSSNKLLRF